MLIAVERNKFIVLFIIIFGTLSFRVRVLAVIFDSAGKCHCCPQEQQRCGHTHTHTTRNGAWERLQCDYCLRSTETICHADRRYTILVKLQ